MAELAGVAITEWAGDLIEQEQTGFGDRNQDGAPIMHLSHARYQFSLFDLIEHSRDVRGPRDKAIGEGERGQAIGVFGPQQAEDVILLGSEVELGEDLIFESAEAVVSAPEVQISLLLGSIEPTSRLLAPARCGHIVILIR